MKMLAFAGRNTKEIVRDKLTVAFGIGFPVVVMLLLSFIQSNIPVQLFQIERLAPGIVVFGLAFISLFSATLISKDRSGSLMMRLLISPMTPADFILGYALPLVPISVAQNVVCYLLAVVLGLPISFNILWAIVLTLPADIFFIAIGLLCGTVFTDKQVGGICGALLTNLTAWLSGTWFELDLVGGAFKAVAEALPFCHAANVGRLALSGDYSKIIPELSWVIGYAAVFMIIAIVVFNIKMKGDKK